MDNRKTAWEQKRTQMYIVRDTENSTILDSEIDEEGLAEIFLCAKTCISGYLRIGVIELKRCAKINKKSHGRFVFDREKSIEALRQYLVIGRLINVYSKKFKQSFSREI